MIERIHIQNYKCLLDTEVTLGPFNVLIGPNDSGKSSFLDGLQLLGAGRLDNPEPLVWQKEKHRNIILDVSGRKGKPFQYQLIIPAATGRVLETLEIAGKRTFQTAYEGGVLVVNDYNPRFNLGETERAIKHVAAHEKHQTGTGGPVTEVLDCLQSSRTFRLDPYAMRIAVQAARNPVLNWRGDNLAAVLQAMLSGPDRKAILDLESKLHDAIPTLKGVSLSTLPDSSHQIEFTLNVDTRPPITIPCAQASDGAMLLTGFLVLAYGNTPERLLIEEPENGLHPSRLKMVIDILRKISTGEIGNQSRQVIVTTHSPLLLNFVQPEEVRIFRRDETQGTKVTAMDQAPDIGRLRRELRRVNCGTCSAKRIW